MLRDYSLSLTFVALLLIAYTAIVLYSKKTGDVNIHTHQAAIHSTGDASQPNSAETTPAESTP